MCNPMLLNSILAAPGAVLADSNFGGELVLPKGQSNHAAYYDPTFDFINIVTVIFFVAIIVVMVWFAWKYRRTDKTEQAEHTASHNTGLELAWSLPPLVIVVFMFYYGFTGYMKMTTVPADAYQINATARKWSWTFTHPNGYTSQTLDVPSGQPVVIRLSSTDVLHSLYIPAFRVKKDVVPGRYNTLWFEATEPTPEADAPLLEGEALDQYIREQLVTELQDEQTGELTPDSPAVTEELESLKPNERDRYARQHQTDIAAAKGHQLYCAEFCGTNHSLMLAKVVVHEEGWTAPTPIKGTPWQEGKKIFEIQCASCHALGPGGPPTCPSFADGILGQQRTFTDGSSVEADEQYIRDSITNPQAQIVTGYQPVMPLMNFTPEELDALVTFLSSPKKEPE